MPRTLSDITVGDIVKLNMNGVLTDYIVVQQGAPADDDYDSSYSGGTWLLMKDIYGTLQLSESSTGFYRGAIKTDYLENIVATLDSDIQAALKTINRKYWYYGNTAESYFYSTAAVKCFILSSYELGGDRFSQGASAGAVISYFSSINNDNSANALRVANYNGTPTEYWTDSMCADYDNHYYVSCTNTGAIVENDRTRTYGIRPVFIFPSTTYVLDDDTVTTNLPPSAPSSIYVPQVTAGSQCVITWGAATDPDGTIASYQLERSVNGSGWSQIFSGNALTYTDTVGEDWGTMAYRVCAVDNNNKSGPYTTSSTITVANGVLYITGPSDNMGELIAPTTVQFSVGVTGDTVQDVSLTIKVDGSVEYDGLVDSAEQVTIDIDTRLLSGGTHVITAVATKQNYIQANGSYIFTTMSIAVPDGGYLEQASNASNTPIFFRTIAAAVAGLSIPMTRDVVLNVTGWVQSSGRYYQTVTVETVQENTAIVLTDCILSDDLDANSAIIEAWGTVMQYAPVQGNGTLTFYATNVPTVNIPVCVGVL